ncbi:MAG TPA: nuclear transport factor 2 family protein [Nitrospiraceae bacterium]|nr:nuclear transport factor 2 family protein [Nitrospiraceae bacterium]
MSSHSPEKLHQQFVAFFNAGDLDGLMTLYEKEAALVPQPGSPVAGYDQNRRALEQFLALNGRIQITTIEVIRTGTLALLRGEWCLEGTGPDGRPMTLSGRNIEVARQQAAGHWQFVIDHPYGAG